MLLSDGISEFLCYFVMVFLFYMLQCWVRLNSMDCNGGSHDLQIGTVTVSPSKQDIKTGHVRVCLTIL
jgi:hypothetical protein